jgi:uncharacterized protein (DUF3820 family)
MSTLDSENWPFPFGKHKGKTLADIPDTYLDWLIGQDWFVKRNREWVEAIGKELATRKRSHYYVEDQIGKVMED